MAGKRVFASKSILPLGSNCSVLKGGMPKTPPLDVNVWLRQFMDVYTGDEKSGVAKTMMFLNTSRNSSLLVLERIIDL